MPRLPRYFLTGHPHHVIQRGNNRCPIFLADEDYLRFSKELLDASVRYECQVHAYVLMTNHVHLILSPQQENSTAKLLQSVGRRYVQYFNFTHKRTGTLWEGRYKSTLIDTENYLLTCYRYIESNPVRANIVSHPGDYQWSSYAANALGHHDPLVTPHPQYSALANEARERQAAYRKLFHSHIDSSTLDEIRYATQKGWALGNERFKDEIERTLQRRVRPLPRGGDRRSALFLKTKN